MFVFETPIASPKKDSGNIRHGLSFPLHGSYSAPAFGSPEESLVWAVQYQT